MFDTFSRRMVRGGPAVLVFLILFLSAAPQAQQPAVAQPAAAQPAAQPAAPLRAGKPTWCCRISASSTSRECNGRTLLLGGLVVCALGLAFGMVIYFQLRNLPVHGSMREISELIYETCKTYLITQGKFILLLEVFIGVIMVVLLRGAAALQRR